MNEALQGRFKVPAGYVIPEADEARLRTLLNLPVGDEGTAPELPDAVVGGYYAMKRCCDLLGCGLTDWQVATVVCLALLSDRGAVSPIELIPEMPPDFREVVRQAKVKMGALVASCGRGTSTASSASRCRSRSAGRIGSWRWTRCGWRGRRSSWSCRGM